MHLVCQEFKKMSPWWYFQILQAETQAGETTVQFEQMPQLRVMIMAPGAGIGLPNTSET